ncbi:hypothetical protein D3C81_1567020 [compost metagenome]
MPPFLIFHTSTVPSPLKPPGVASLANCGAALMRRGSMLKPAPPSVLMVQGVLSVPSERPKMNSRWRAALSLAWSAAESRSIVSGINFRPSALPGLAGSNAVGSMLTSWPL